MKQQITKKLQKGFTLIELLVVIAILGVLAVVLLVVINPLDKINLANDTGLIATFTQLGRANDAYAAQHSNAYTSGQGTATCTGAGATVSVATNSFPGAVQDLCSAGESKFATIAAPSAAYTLYYFVTPTGCADSANSCTGALFGVGPLQAKKYAANPYFIYTNGKSCFVAAAPTQATIGTCP
jgi:prepilin-type N-terminal cleavage/methylation domain-containing protein